MRILHFTLRTPIHTVPRALSFSRIHRMYLCVFERADISERAHGVGGSGRHFYLLRDTDAHGANNSAVHGDYGAYRGYWTWYISGYGSMAVRTRHWATGALAAELCIFTHRWRHSAEGVHRRWPFGLVKHLMDVFYFTTRSAGLRRPCGRVGMTIGHSTLFLTHPHPHSVAGAGLASIR